MARPSDKEFALHRKLKNLQEENDKLKNEIIKLKQQLEKIENPKIAKEDKKKPGKKILKPCPDCGAEIKVTDLPHGTMELCSAACGWRRVRNK